MDLDSLFPVKTEIPEEFIIGDYEQRTYLINGVMKHWNGPMQKVYSPVCVRDSGLPEQVLIGSYPLLGEKEALEALEAAEGAYDLGRGVWPTMSVEMRIKHAGTNKRHP